MNVFDFQVLVKGFLDFTSIARLSWAKMLSSTIFPLGSSLVTKVEIPGSKVGKIQCIHKVPFLKTPQVPLHIGVGGREFGIL